MRAEIAAALRADSTLAGLLPGGIYDGVTEISRQATPQAFDGNSTIKPCAIVKLDADTPAGPLWYSAREGLSIYLYQPKGTGVLDQARRRIYQLLHRQRIAPAAGGAWELLHAGDVTDIQDQDLRASQAISRYTATINKRSI